MTAIRFFTSRRAVTSIRCPQRSSAAARIRKLLALRRRDLLAACGAAAVEGLERRALLSGSAFGPTDPVSPSAVFAPLAPVTAAGGAGETIRVTYADNAAVDIASIGTDNLVITGPGGQILPAVSASPDADTYAAVIDVTYTLPAPAGGWSPLDNGTYNIAVNTAGPGAVTDTSGNPVTTSVAAFTVAVPLPPPPAASVSPAPSVTRYHQATETVQVNYTASAALDLATINPNNLRVTAPGGLPLTVTSASVSGATVGGNSSSLAITATYTVAAPSGGWDSGDDGAYSVSVATSGPGAVSDIYGSPVTSAAGSFSMAVAPPPTASVSQPALVTVYGSPSEAIRVNYASTAPLDLSTFAPGNLLITSPNGQALTVTGASTGAAGGATSATVTYTVAAPGGRWTPDDNGTYNVSVRTGGSLAVADTAGSPVTAASGSFPVNVAPPPIAAVVPAAAVTAYGSTTETLQVNYTASVPFNLSSIGTGNLTVTAPAGQPLAVIGATASPSADGTFATVTYTISAPAGGWTATGNGAYAVSVNTSGPGTVTDSAGSTVTAAVGSFNVRVYPPPVATLHRPADISQISPTPQTIVLTYADAAGVDANSISPANLHVTGPTGQPLAVTAVSVTPPGNAAAITASYTVAPPAGTGAFWSAGDDGAYTVTLLPNQVTNIGGTPAASVSSQFSVNIAQPPATVDPSFFGGGSVSSGFVAEGAAVQADGKIVLAGRAGDLAAGTSQSVVERLNPDGTLDTSFGTGGKFTSPAGGNDADYAVALGAGGAIVTAGTHHGQFSVSRYLPSGAPDASFGSAGQAVTSLGGSADTAYALAVAPDGSVVAGGTSNGSFAFARYLSDGSLDTFFGTRGVSLFALGAAGTANTVGGVALSPDGSIVAAGSSGSQVALIRLTANGAPDAAFSDAGVMLVPGMQAPQTSGAAAGSPATASNPVEGLAVQGDGKILVANTSAAGHFGVARVDPDGTLDSTFGVAGLATADFGGHDSADAIVTRPGGEILVVGTTDAGATPQIAVAAFGRNGAPDPTFGSAGLFTLPAGITAPPGSLSPQAIHVGDLFLHAFGASAPNGKLVVGSTDESPGGNTSSGLRRLNVPGTGLIGAFGSSGKNGKSHSLTFQDNNGVTVTLQIKGAGLGQAFYDGNPIDLVLTGTGPTTAVAVRGKGGRNRGQVALLNVQSDGGLKSFNAPTAVLAGTFSAKGAVGQIALQGLSGTIASAGSIASVIVGAGGLAGAHILAGADLGSDGQLNGSGTAADTFAAASLGRLRVAGDVTGSLVAAGLEPADGVLLSPDDKVLGGSSSRIGSIAVRGSVDSSSRFIAGAFGPVSAPKRIKDLSTDGRFEVL